MANTKQKLRAASRKKRGRGELKRPLTNVVSKNEDGSFVVNGAAIFADNVNITQSSRMSSVDVLDRLEVAEYAETPPHMEITMTFRGEFVETQELDPLRIQTVKKGQILHHNGTAYVVTNSGIELVSDIEEEETPKAEDLLSDNSLEPLRRRVNNFVLE